jgi:hypothetical protein
MGLEFGPERKNPQSLLDKKHITKIISIEIQVLDLSL